VTGRTTRSGEELLPPDLLDRLRALREIAFRIRRKREMQGPGPGQAPEFDSHRSYEPGDDPRYIDWSLYARLEKLLLKTYVVDEEAQVTILLDTSGSMRRGEGRKFLAARRAAAAFAWLALAASHRLVVGAFSAGLHGVRGPFRSLRQFAAALDFLREPPTGRGTDLGRSLASLPAGTRGRGLILVVSDFFQEGDVVRELDAAAARSHDLHLIQVVDDDELAPPIRGEFTLSDAEGDETVTASVGWELIETFHRLIADHLETLRLASRERSIPYLLARTSRNTGDLVIAHLLGQEGEGYGRRT
jgi:uncharacterized protein (DUF58 family)